MQPALIHFSMSPKLNICTICTAHGVTMLGKLGKEKLLLFKIIQLIES